MMVIGPDIGGIWVMSTRGSVSRRLSSATGVGVWASNEQWIGNAAEGTGWSTLFLDSIDGSTPRQVLLAPGDLWDVSPSSVSANGVLAFNTRVERKEAEEGTTTTGRATRGGTSSPHHRKRTIRPPEPTKTVHSQREQSTRIARIQIILLRRTTT